MAARAFILIETASGSNKEVLSALQQIDGVESVTSVTGPYDLIATLAAETLNDIGQLASAKIDPIAGIARTVTCLVIDGEKG